MPQYFGKLPSSPQPWNGLDAVQSVQPSGRQIYFDCGGPQVAIAVLAPNLVRVRMSPTGEFMPRRSWAVTLPDEAWPETDFTLEQTADVATLQTARMEVGINLNPPRITCRNPQGQPFAADTEAGMRWRMGAIACAKHIEAEEHFYGFGERTGLLDKRSKVATNWTTDALDYGVLTDEMYQAIPFFMALRPNVGYGIFLNSPFWSQFDIGAAQAGVSSMETRADELDYYIIYGPEPERILATYTELTGRMPMPPKWALGYHQCRWSYDSQAEVLQLAREFRDRRIPCDVIHLDIDYMRGYRVFTWSPFRFPDPAETLAQLQRNGFHTVAIVDPGVKYEPEADYPAFDAGCAGDYFVRKADGQLFHGYVWPDKALFPDFLRRDVRHWWGECHKSLTDVGVAGIWNDMNEPAIADRPFGDNGEKISFPLDAPQGPPEERTTHAEVHNLYGHMMAKSCYEGLRRHRPEKRSFVLTRSGFAGIQRWSSVWMGDNQSLWEHLEMSLPMLCNMGLSGVPFVGCDIGGFAGNATAELFARWMQVGMLYPLMRAHSALGTERHEPWCFGEAQERICREYIELRYRLLPYIYSLFWESATSGAPILRPLLYHFPRDRQTYTLHDQVMLGPFLMAAPVYRPGVTCRAVYLPAGVWYDWWTGELHKGPGYILAAAPLNRMPLYVSAGAIIPMAPVMQYANERPLDALRIRIWPITGPETLHKTFVLYEDDGDSFAYEQGDRSTITYSVTQDERQLVVEISARDGNWIPPKREIIIEAIGIGEQRFADDGSPRQLRFIP
ncbi:glycoside hydrolase family 31 protein [Phormidium sp. CCY1219]|uniref:glycoside hydrolase family 31 protein n=1 Tax=Phormidium sp. CCY1219 TaxID=2886104 RepID=UPI002D1F31C2|nr:glycoside hydrolase family 31 protein [Phormidium sp. CCY1219]MEB3827710.1 glycoside hydrolase family 31 protein [Phormidium sp. CCY1219]